MLFCLHFCTLTFALTIFAKKMYIPLFYSLYRSAPAPSIPIKTANYTKVLVNGMIVPNQIPS